MPVAKRKKSKPKYTMMALPQWVCEKIIRIDPKRRKSPQAMAREILCKAVAAMPDVQPVPVATVPAKPKPKSTPSGDEPPFTEQLYRRYPSRNWAVSEDKFELWSRMAETERVVIELFDGNKIRYHWHFNPDQLEYHEEGQYGPYHLLQADELYANREDGIGRGEYR